MSTAQLQQWIDGLFTAIEAATTNVFESLALKALNAIIDTLLRELIGLLPADFLNLSLTSAVDELFAALEAKLAGRAVLLALAREANAIIDSLLPVAMPSLKTAG